MDAKNVIIELEKPFDLIEYKLLVDGRKGAEEKLHKMSQKKQAIDKRIQDENYGDLRIANKNPRGDNLTPHSQQREVLCGSLSRDSNSTKPEEAGSL